MTMLTLTILKTLTTEVYAGKKRRKAIVKCFCGEVFKASVTAIKRGATKSCGCSRKTHGKTGTKERDAWCMMKQRCYNPKTQSFKYYGSKGVTVCDRWLNSFENFFLDVGEAPSKDHSLDRYPNPEGNYEPGNVRWATSFEQIHNRRKRK